MLFVLSVVNRDLVHLAVGIERWDILPSCPLQFRRRMTMSDDPFSLLMAVNGALPP